MADSVSAALAEETERRRAPRVTMLKRAQLVARGAVYDCILLDMNDYGARIRTGTPIPLPPQVELRLPGGVSLAAMNRWARGADVGLEFLADGASLRGEAAQHARAAYEFLRDGQFEKAVRGLRGAGFFDDVALRRAVEEAEGARNRLESLLRERIRAAGIDSTARKP